MFRRARELGPALLVPLAWIVVAAAHLGAVTAHALFVAHVVMVVLLVGFAATGRADMREGTLRIWWKVIAVGTVPTLAGAVGFLAGTASGALHAVALGGWMLLPAVGFVDTGRRVREGTWIYVGGAAGCLLGAVVYGVGATATAGTGTGIGIGTSGAAWELAGLALVGVAQTAAILDAVVRY